MSQGERDCTASGTGKTKLVMTAGDSGVGGVLPNHSGHRKPCSAGCGWGPPDTFARESWRHRS